MIRKTRTKASSKNDQHEDTAQPPQHDEQAQQVSQDTAELLEDIDCCLAEVENQAEQAEKLKARQEWEALHVGLPANDDEYMMWKGSRAEGDYVQKRALWMAQYQHLFLFCCGEPIFDD